MHENLLVCQILYKISLVLNEDKAFEYEKLFVYQSVYEIRLVLNVDKAFGYQTFFVHQSLYEMNLVRNVDHAFGYQKRFVYQYGYHDSEPSSECRQNYSFHPNLPLPQFPPQFAPLFTIKS